MEPLKAQTNDSSNSLNNYSFDLYRNIKVEKENLFLSPFSSYYALLMAYEGSKNKTKHEFEKVLYLKNNTSSNINWLHSIATKSDSCMELNVSNAIWLDKSYPAEEYYQKAITEKYSADFKQTQFNKTELAVSEINKWVSEKTNKEITQIVSISDIHHNTKLLISNAIYFKGEWLRKFDKQKTNTAFFFSSVENQYKIDFLNTTEELEYFEDENIQFISKPYLNSELSFCIILPKKLFGIEEIEKTMNNHFFNKILDQSYSTKTSITIPKLKFESSIEMSDALINSGLKTAFSSKADFSGITKEVPLMLDRVLHKACIEIDEEKTKATAATVASMRITGVPSFKVFKADHPFIFFITDNRSRSILFMGRYISPSNAKPIDNENLADNIEKREKEKFESGNPRDKLLYILNKKRISQEKIKTIDPKNIESMKIYKTKEEISKYTSKNYDGVIVISLKKKHQQK